MSDDFNIIGFHGTFKSTAELIIKDGFTFEYRNNHWLGQGIYFYDNYELAYWFISRNSETDPRKSGKGTALVVIKSLISSNTKFLLDLDSIDGVNYFYRKVDELKEAFKTVQFGDNEHKNLCFVLDVLAEKFNIQVIIKTFETDNPTYGVANTGLFDKKKFPLNVKYKERQICVRSNPCIKILDMEYPDTKYVVMPKIKLSLE